MNNKVSLDDYLNEKTKNGLGKPKKVRKTRKIFKPFIASALALTTLLGLGSCNRKKTNETENIQEPISNVEGLDLVSLNSLGRKDPWVKNPSSIYSNATGNIDINQVTQGSNGKYYATKEDAERAKNAGVTYDDKGGTLTITKDSNGNDIAIDNTPADSYIEVDEKGNQTVKPLDENGIPEGYHEETPGEFYEDGYIVAPYNLYSSNGDVVIMKGDTVRESEWNEYVKRYYKEKPANPTQTTREEIISEYYYDDVDMDSQVNSVEQNVEDQPNNTQPTVEDQPNNTASENTNSSSETIVSETYEFDGIVFNSYAELEAYIDQKYNNYGIDGETGEEIIVDENGGYQYVR